MPAVASNASLNYYKNVYIGKDILDFCLSNSQTFPNSNPSKKALDGRRLFSVYRKIRFWILSYVGETFLEPIAIVSDPSQKSLRIGPLDGNEVCFSEQGTSEHLKRVRVERTRVERVEE